MSDWIKFWGVRGSIATPGAETSAVGGNTSCVEVMLGEERIILDGGTGLRALGQAHGNRPMQATILFSHLHWDHIQGIPFFAPLYHPQSKIRLLGPAGLQEALQRQMSGPNFPVGMDAMGARIDFQCVEPGDCFSIGEVEVTVCALRHPGGAQGYRLCGRDQVIAYACDTEHSEFEIDDELRQLADCADVLIYDAQYLPEEYQAKQGWGHSTYEQGCALANTSSARRLLLSHHEPGRSDEQVHALELRAQKLFARSLAAREGMILYLGSVDADRAQQWLTDSLLAPDQDSG